MAQTNDGEHYSTGEEESMTENTAACVLLVGDLITIRHAVPFF